MQKQISFKCIGTTCLNYNIAIQQNTYNGGRNKSESLLLLRDLANKLRYHSFIPKT